MSQPSFHDVELLSVYLDGQLSQVDSARLESRLKTDPELRSIYDDLRQARSLLHKLPARRAPRNFTLTPKMAGIKPPLPRIFPVFRLASTLAAILFFFSYAVNLSIPAITSMRAAAPAPAYGMGGGGGGPSEPSSMEMATGLAEAPAPMVASATEEAAQDNVAATSTVEEKNRLMPTEMGTQADAQQKFNPYDAQIQPQPQSQPVSLPFPPAWLFGLLALAVISGGSALFVRTKAEQDWRRANAIKPRKLTIRDILVFGLVVLMVLLLGTGIYWMSTTTFYTPVAMNDPSGAASDGKGNAPISPPQDIPLVPGSAYNFSTTDGQGRITAIDFPPEAVEKETTVLFIPGLNSSGPAVTFFASHAFALVPSPKSTVLQAPVTITMEYGEETASTTDETRLALYWWSGDEWRDAAMTCSPESIYERIPESNRLRVSVCELGSFVLVVP